MVPTQLRLRLAVTDGAKITSLCIRERIGLFTKRLESVQELEKL
jgi:hypothetical protein